MSAPLPGMRIIGGRYQIRSVPVGQGGMGVVYMAYDSVTKRDVALKSLRGAVEPAALELFAKEWTVLAKLSHPNIVDILDTGEFEQNGQKVPFFVMPLLPGVTLDNLIRKASPRLTVGRVIEMVTQTCRGLQAAHDKGIIHRDLKPSNIFVMDDDTVKIIDFGVVHLADAQSMTGVKGTLPYMAPEQVDMKPATPASDIFSLGVVCYEALTGRKPFARENDIETIRALRHYIPPAISEVNATVNQLVSRVVHRAMAKQPSYRFHSARDFAEGLQRALRNEPIEAFDRARIGARVERVKKACQSGDYEFANDILTEMEAEGHLDPDMHLLRLQIDQSLRQKTIRQLLESARTRLEEDEFPLALQKIQEALELDPANAEARILAAQIEQRRGSRQVGNWLQLAREHMDNHLYKQARQALQEILKINPADAKARELMAEADRREQDFISNRNQKEQLYQAAMQAYQGGEISSALSKLERVLELGRAMPGSASADKEAQYQSFYNQVRSERDLYRNGYGEARKQLADRNFDAALELCAGFLQKYPGDPLFQALKLEIEEQQRQEHSAFVVEMNKRVEAEADLDRKFAILQEATERFPHEAHFQQALRLTRERRDLVNGIVNKARQYEERGQYADALGQWDIVRSIYGQYPGLDFELQRLKRRREGQLREEAKARWVDQIDHCLESAEYTRAEELVRNALIEYPQDRELLGLERLAQQGIERSAEAQKWLAQGQKLCGDGQFGPGLDALKKAEELDGKNPLIRGALLSALLEQARSILAMDWRAAEPLIQHALNLDGNHTVAKSLRSLVDDYKRQQAVEELVCQARELQAAGEIESALEKTEQGLALFPHDFRLAQLRTTLRNALPESSRREMRERYLQELKALVSVIDQTSDAAQTLILLEQSRALAQRYPDDADFQAIAAGIESRVKNSEESRYGEQTASNAGLPELTRTIHQTDSAPEPRDEEAVGRKSTGPAPLHDALRTAGSHLQKLAEVRRTGSALQWTVVGVGAALLVSAYVVTTSHKKPRPQVSVEFPVEVHANANHVLYMIDGRQVTGAIKLPKGPHHLDVSAVGFKSDSQDFTLKDGVPSPYRMELKLVPEPVRLQVVSDLVNGKVSIDKQDPIALQDAGPSNELTPGEHSLAVLQDTRELLTLAFKADPGEAPSLLGPVQAKDVTAVLISSLSDRGRVYGAGPFKVNLPGQVPDLIPPDGFVLTGLNPGTAQVSVDDGKNIRPFPIELDNAPHLNLWVNSDRNIGFLTVQANVPDAEVYVDGRPAKRPALRNGRVVLNLEPKTYSVRVVAPGYEDAGEQSVDIHKGEPKELKFELKPAITTASLEITAARRRRKCGWITRELVRSMPPARLPGKASLREAT